jgi:signal transduction histidine kinase
MKSQSSTYTTRRFVSLRTKLVGLISLIIVVACSSLSWYFIQRQTDSMTRSLINTGTILVRNLAHNSRYGLFTEDQLLLGQLIDGVMDVEEVVYVIFTGPEGRQLVARNKGILIEDKSLTRSPATPLYPNPHFARVLFEQVSRAPVITPFTTTGGEVLYDFAVSVLRRSQPQSLDPQFSVEAQEAQEETDVAANSPVKVYGVVQIGLSGAKLELALRTAIWDVALITVIIILGGIATTIMLAGRIVTPLRSLAAVASRIAAGNLTASVEPTTYDEVGQLTDIFNHMTQSMASHIHTITELTQTLEQRVEERTRELQEANRQLEAASRHKSEFLANMSHELRTPLNAVIGFTRLVMRHSQEVMPQKQYENLEKVLVSAERLLALINDALDLSKIEAGRLEVQPVSFALETLIDVCLRTVEPMVKGERLHLVKELEADPPLLYTDQDKLQQILLNLLSNALKFTEEGTITVSAQHRDGQIAIAVADTGIGISEDALEVIFEEFRQGDSGTTRRYGGTGLGLSISRHLARLLGGDITVTSAVGAGSTFTVTLPIRYPVHLGPLISRQQTG